MIDAASELNHAPRERHLSRLNKVLAVLIAAGIAVPVAFRTLPVVKDKVVQDTALTAVEADLEEMRMQNARLTNEVHRLQTDPEYMGMFARDLVTPGYMAPGETIFRFPIPTRP
ncbi:MAG: septum formation initiator family protein [Chthoniobacteraceae bacterium]